MYILCRTSVLTAKQISKWLAADCDASAEVHNFAQPDHVKSAISHHFTELACFFLAAEVGYAGCADK